MENSGYYNEHADEFYRDTIGLDLGQLYAPFLKFVPKGGKILDAGCGSGRDSLYFLRNGYEVSAFDASPALAALSSRLLGDRVQLLSFQQIEFENEFDAIWACASLLHVSRIDINDVINRLALALKQSGVLYASFKYGDKEEVKDGRLFNYYDETSFDQLLYAHPTLSLLDDWKSQDVRESRKDEYWFNVLLKKSR